MANLNKVLIIGRLTRDPELRYTPQGTAVTELGIAVNREYGVGNERRKETTFVDVTLWARQAEVVCQYLTKGRQIFIEGRLSLDTWEGKDGQRRSKLRVIGENFQFLDSRGDNAASSRESSDYGRSYSDSGEPRGHAAQGGGRLPAGDEFSGAPAVESNPSEGEGLGIPDEEIPF